MQSEITVIKDVDLVNTISDVRIILESSAVVRNYNEMLANDMVAHVIEHLTDVKERFERERYGN